MLSHRVLIVVNALIIIIVHQLETFLYPEYRSLPDEGRASQALDRLQTLGELIPILHDNANTQSLEGLGHLLLLLAAAVAPDVSNDRDAGADGTQCAALAVLHGNALSGLLADDLAGVEVDGWVRFGGWRRQRSGSAEDVIFREVFGLVDLVDAGLNTA